VSLIAQNRQAIVFKKINLRLARWHGTCGAASMSPSDKRLLRHLAIAVLIKLVLLTALWWLFIRDARVSVDVDDVAGKINSTMSAQVIPYEGVSK
jgi:hypothetical protein